METRLAKDAEAARPGAGVRSQGALARALLALVEGLERGAASALWPALTERTAEAKRELKAQLGVSGVDPWGVDPPALLALRTVQTTRATQKPVSAACLLLAVLGRAEVRLLTGLEALSPASMPASVPEAAFAAALEPAARVVSEVARAAAGGITSAHAGLAVLNAQAGAHPIPDDLRVIAIALEAGQRSFDAYAYYALRYGDRGRAFTRSDSAWLVAIATGPEFVRQVLWLAGVLSARGMPSLLMEEHLDELARALIETVPARATEAKGLRAAAAALAERRIRALPDPDRWQRALTRELSVLPSSERGVAIEPSEAATLVVAANADALAGQRGARESLELWLAEPTRFGPRWCAIVAGALSDRATT